MRRAASAKNTDHDAARKKHNGQPGANYKTRLVRHRRRGPLQEKQWMESNRLERFEPIDMSIDGPATPVTAQ
jgi:hypothetical protein